MQHYSIHSCLFSPYNNLLTSLVLSQICHICMRWQRLYVLTNIFPTLASPSPTKLKCAVECQVNGENVGIHAVKQSRQKKGNFNMGPALPALRLVTQPPYLPEVEAT